MRGKGSDGDTWREIVTGFLLTGTRRDHGRCGPGGKKANAVPAGARLVGYRWDYDHLVYGL